MNMNPRDFVYAILHVVKAGAILRKNEILKLFNALKCNGFYKIK